MTERSSAAAARPYTESEIEAMTTEELLLTYTDAGGDTLTAGWSARDNRRGEG